MPIKNLTLQKIFGGRLVAIVCKKFTKMLAKTVNLPIPQEYLDTF